MVFLKAFLVLSFSLFSIAIERDVIHYRHIALYEFDRQFEGQINSHVAYENITSVYGENSVSYSTVRRWFEHFKAGNFELEDKPIPGRPETFADEEIQKLLEENPWTTQDQLAEALGIAQTTVSYRLRRMEKVMKNNRWVPHELTEEQKFSHVAICDSLIARYNRENFWIS